MKRTITCLTLIALAALSIMAQSLKDNSFYQRSLELGAMASQAFEDGDYDAATEYASLAREYAKLSDNYVAKIVAMTDADRAIVAAKKDLGWADSIGAKADYQSQYAEAAGAMDASLSSYGKEEYIQAGDSARKVSSTVLGIASADADKTIASAKARMAWAEKAGVPKRYADVWAKAGDAMGRADQAFAQGDFFSAGSEARGVLAALASVGAQAVLPASYKVRLILERRDCLWRIAEYPFVYNNPLKWRVLYDANKTTFRDPQNPDLIFPGQILVIPSIAGEQRSGAWDPSKKYEPFAGK